jgi:plastocyanin
MSMPKRMDAMLSVLSQLSGRVCNTRALFPLHDYQALSHVRHTRLSIAIADLKACHGTPKRWRVCRHKWLAKLEDSEMPGTRPLALVVLLTMGCVACGGGGSSATPPPTAGIAGVDLGSPSVVISATDQNVFDPAMQNATVGEVIEWKNTGSVEHDIVFSADTSNAKFSGDSEPVLKDQVLAPGGVWQVKFTKVGTYSYLCTLHPGMVGAIAVKAGSDG